MTNTATIPVTEKKDLPNKTIEISTRHTAEFIIGLCGPIGSPINTVSEKLQEILKEEYDYKCEEIKMSDLIKKYSAFKDYASEVDRVQKLIQLGDQLRDKYTSKILSEIAIHQISFQRNSEKISAGREEYSSKRKCFIINSIKNKEELVLFREVYGELFYCFGIFSPIAQRTEALKKKGMTDSEIWTLIDQDSGEEIPHGQSVRDTFPQSDFFLRISANTNSEIENKIRRYLHLIFGTEIITPNDNETAMYLATSAASNSACLSRQVGACITDQYGDIISIGWNDVPRAGGGLIQNKDNPDNRCYNLNGECRNDIEKDLIIEGVVNALINNENGLLAEEDKSNAINILKQSKIKDLIEFSRAIHAEMFAIISGSQKCGSRMVNGKLYCTTYPCHSCARHIVAAGIKEVYYIEPYRKSLAIKLHSDSITESEEQTNKVKILIYDGVSPRRYLDLFKNNSTIRKNKSKKSTNNKKAATPQLKVSLDSFPILENIVVSNLVAKNLITVDQ